MTYETEPGDHADRYAGVGRVLVIIPTYNEADNLSDVVARLHAAVPSVHVLVVDDNSPDGTGQLADSLAAQSPRIHVMHRPGKGGLAAAYLAGFGWAIDNGYDAVCEMDADGSHIPEQLHRLLDGLLDADVVLGSRYVPGGCVVNWSPHRSFLSRSANTYTRIALGLSLSDSTGGFRVYKTPALDKIIRDWQPPQGYCFQISLAWRAVRAGLTVTEVPITFAGREYGTSKMDSSIILEGLWRVTSWGLQERLRRARATISGTAR